MSISKTKEKVVNVRKNVSEKKMKSTTHTQRYFLLGCPIKGKKGSKCPNEYFFSSNKISRAYNPLLRMRKREDATCKSLDQVTCIETEMRRVQQYF